MDRRAFTAAFVLYGIEAMAGDDLFQPTGKYAAPRQPRILFFHASWCNPCHAALEGSESFPDWLRASGWSVGESARDHVQLVDIDKQPELAKKHGISSIPAMVLLDGTNHKPVSYTGRGSLVALVEKPKAATPKAASHAGQHSHRCSQGHVWWHGPEAVFNPRAHNCPSCGRYQNVINEFGR